jgi:hypothetical protein
MVRNIIPGRKKYCKHGSRPFQTIIIIINIIRASISPFALSKHSSLPRKLETSFFDVEVVHPLPLIHHTHHHT